MALARMPGSPAPDGARAAATDEEAAAARDPV